MSSCRVYGIVIHRWLHVRTNITEPSNFAQLARTRSLCSRVFRAHVSSKGSRVHMPTSVCYPYLSLGGKDDCFRVLDSHIPTEKPQLRLLFSPFSITMATATPTSKTMATYTPTCISTTTALTYKGRCVLGIGTSPAI